MSTYARVLPSEYTDPNKNKPSTKCSLKNADLQLLQKFLVLLRWQCASKQKWRLSENLKAM